MKPEEIIKFIEWQVDLVQRQLALLEDYLYAVELMWRNYK